ncbi:MAG TPA: Wzz/FepE/Etk N-terminal domain-containing protein [Terriglobia bacterium]|nr:Wzz/FepE/Etk N-terminal domain-containing protein [Terriglobia bacterium]
MREVVSVVFRRRRLIVLSFIGLIAGALLAVWLIPPSYQAEMKILVERERVDPVVSTNPSVIQADRSLTPDEVSSEVELFQSRDSLEKAVMDCGLYETKGRWSLSAIKLHLLEALGHATDKNTQIYDAVLQLEHDLQVIPINNSNLIKVTYDAHSPELAARVLKELSNLYLAKHLSVRRPPGTSQFFDQQAEQYKKDLENAQENLVSFDTRTGVTSADFEKQVALQKYSDFQISLEQTRADVANAKQRLRALEAQEASIPSRITTQVRVADNPQLMADLKSTLLNLELKRTELLEKYNPSYPLVQEVENQIKQSLAAITDAEKKGVREETSDQDPTHEWVRTELAKTRADLVGLEARASVMSGAVRDLQGRALRLDQASVTQQDLLRTVKANEQDYLLYRKKREEARIDDALDQKRVVNVAVAEAAAIPWVPAGLSTPDKLVLAFLLAALFSLGLGFLSEYLDPSFRTPDEITEHLDIPVLASIPKNGH